MKAERVFERMGEYRKALKRLREAVMAPDSELKPDAVIQRFEFCYEMAWKLIKLYLEGKGTLVNSPREIWREALQHGLVTDGNGWTQLHKYRNQTSHTYDETLALEVNQFIEIKGLNLLETLEGELTRQMEMGL